MQQFRNGIVLAWNRMMSVKTKKRGRILKSSLEMEVTETADYLDTREERGRKRMAASL